MAKKKNNNKQQQQQKSSPPNGKEAPEAAAELSVEASEGADASSLPPTPTPESAPQQPEPEASTEAAAPAASASPEPIESTSEIAAQLAQAREEIQQLKAQLAVRDREISELKEQAAAMPTTRAEDTTDGNQARRSEEYALLQKKLAALKQEQAEADAAREAAWRQLKSVVQEISKLAAPESLSSQATPTAGSAPVSAFA